MTRTARPFHIADASIRVDSMPTAGRDLHLSVDADDLGILAAELQVSAVNILDIRMHAVRFRGGIRVTGRLTAEIVQPSVVTLDPVVQKLDEPIDRVFLPGGEKPFVDAADAEVFVDLEGEDLPDHFEGNEANMTPLIVETLALAIDPYPRNSGEQLPAEGVGDAKESPFARLKALKDKLEP
jgi:uncharacterized metal-binding protein YceD (DUF177 family)